MPTAIPAKTKKVPTASSMARYHVLCRCAVVAWLTDPRGGDETATRVAAKFMSAIAAIQILTQQRVRLLESNHSISFRAETGAANMKKP
jgi:hypothetical protein